MNCNNLRDHLADYLYGELGDEERAVLETHLRSCPRCADEVASLRQTMLAMNRWKAPDAPAGMDTTPMAMAHRAPGAPRVSPVWKGVLTGAVAAVVTFAVLTYMGTSIQRRDGQLRIAFRGDDGGQTMDKTHKGSSEFMLLLLERSGGDLDPARENELVGEYQQWAAGVGEEGRAIKGEKLTEARLLLTSNERGEINARHEAVGSTTGSPTGTSTGSSNGAADIVAGYFRISADSMDDAQVVARTCPHLKYGGRIEVREVDERTRD